MITESDYEYIKNIKLDSDSFLKNDDSVSFVAHLIDDNYGFNTTTDVILYFEKPWKWQSDIDEMIKEYEQDLLSKTQCKDCKYFDGYYCGDNADDLEMNCTNYVNKLMEISNV